MATQTSNLQLVKPALDDDALITDINGNMDKIDQYAGTTNTAIANTQGGLAYIVGNTNTTGSTLAVGQFVYVKGHSTIAEGLRKVTASISANGSITTSNTTAVSGGGLNEFNRKFTLESNVSTTFDNEKLTEAVGYRNGNIVMVRVTIKAGLSATWHNDIVTGLSSRFVPTLAIFGVHRVNASADLTKHSICVLNSNGTVQFLCDQIYSADIPFEFVFPAESL